MLMSFSIVIDFLILARLHTAEAHCYELKSVQRPSITDFTTNECSDPKCCSYTVRDSGYMTAEFVDETKTCQFSFSDPLLASGNGAITFVRESGCVWSDKEMCTLHDTYLDSLFTIMHVSAFNDCVVLCNFGNNCRAAIWRKSTNECYWTYYSSIMNTAVPNTDYESSVRCYLTTTTTTTTSTTTATPTSTTTTTTATSITSPITTTDGSALTTTSTTTISSTTDETTNTQSAHCYRLYSAERPSITDFTTNGCSDSKCCSNTVSNAGYKTAQFVEGTKTCEFSFSDPHLVSGWGTATFIRASGCDWPDGQMCTLPDTKLPITFLIKHVSAINDCVVLCNLGNNCMAAIWRKSTNECYWTYYSSITNTAVPNTDYESSVRCHLLNATTTPTSTGTTTTTAATITTTDGSALTTTSTTTMTSTTTTPTTTTSTTTATPTSTTTTTTATSITSTITTTDGSALTTTSTTTITSTTDVTTTQSGATDSAASAGPTSRPTTAISNKNYLLELEAQAGTGSILDLSRHGVDIQHCHSLVYQVMGCQEHGLSLLDNDGAELLSLVIGSDSNSMIRIVGGPSVSTPNILNCNEFRWFWVRWLGRTVMYGIGMDSTAAATIEHSDDAVLLVKRLGLKKINTTPSVIRLGSNGKSRLERILQLGKFADGLIKEVPANHFSKCASICTAHAECGMFSFNQADGLCDIFDRMTSSFQLTSSASWKSWKMIYCYQYQ